MNQNTNNLGISMRNSTDIVAHSISLIKDNRVVSLEDYITEIAGDGGNNVDLSNYYTETETDNLLNTKLNVNNPQDILGNLRLDPTNGNSKIILNAVGAPNDEDFYVNGNSFINGEMRASSMKCDNTFTFATIKGNFISNNDANTDLKFQINTNDFITLSTANDVIEVDKDIEMHSSTLKSDVLDTWSNASLQIRRNGTNYISLDGDDTISISRQSKISSNKADGVDMTVSHHNNTTNLFEKKLSFKNGNEIFATGDGGADEELLLNYYTDYGVRIGNATDAYLTIKGARNGTDTLTVNGSTYFGGAVSYNGDIVLTDPYVLKTNKVSSNTLADLVFEIDTVGEWFRCQASDFTVRLPNNRSFLAQNITVDNLQPLSFGNDLILYGGNNTDAYEEYIRLDASTDKVIVSKIIDTSEDIILLQNKKLYLDDTVNKNRYIRSSYRASPPIEQLDIINETSGGRIRLILDANGSTTTDEQFIVENTGITCRRILKAGQGLNTNTINTNTDINLTISRNGNEFLRLDKDDDNIVCSKEIVLSGDLNLPTSNTQYIKFLNCNIRQGVATIVYFDFNVDTATGQYRFFINSNTILNLAPATTTISNTLQVNTINSNGNNDLVFSRNGNEFLRFDTTDDNIVCSKEIVAGNAVIVDTAKKLTMKPSLESGINIFDIRNLHPVVDNPMIRFRVGVGTGETILCEMRNEGITIARNITIGTAYQLKTNTINTNGDNDLVFQRNDVPFMTLDKFTEDVNGTPTEREAIILSKQLRANAHIRVNNLQINQFSSGVQYADIRLENIDSVMRFYVGNGTNANIQMTNTSIELRRETTISGVKTNTIDTTGDNDLLIRRGGTDVLNIFTYTPTNGPTIIVDAQSDCGISSSWLFANTFANRTPNTNTEFRGAVSGGLGSAKIYMTYLHATETLDFDCDIDNTGRPVIGNIFDTTASDEKLKTNIKDVESNFTECVKNVKIKTFEYKHEKYKNNDKYGMIAQDLHAHLPNEFKNIVKENKDKHSDDKYLSINYMKLSLVLWRALQETLTKVEHLESSVYELQEELKDSKKPTPKSKAKTKAKTSK